MEKNSAAALKKGADLAGEPQSRENRAHRTGESGGQMVLRDHERDVLGYPVVSPDLQDMFRQLRFFVERLPGDSARLVGIVFERDECQILQVTVRFQVGDEASHPRLSALVVGPDGDVFVDAFENGAAEF